MPHIPIGFDITELIMSILMGAISFQVLCLFYDIKQHHIVDKGTVGFFFCVTFLLVRGSIHFFIVFLRVNYEYFNMALFIPLTTYLQNHNYDLLLKIANFYLDLI